MTRIRNTNHLLVATMLVLSTFVVTTLPSAAAHYCAGVDPGSTCGDCNDGLPHDHRYVNGSRYCYSTLGAPPLSCRELTRAVDTKYDVCDTDVIITPVEPIGPGPRPVQVTEGGSYLLS